MIEAVAAAAGIGAAAAYAGPGLAPVVPSVGRALDLLMREEGEEGVAITFDDGPHCKGTPKMLEILRDHDAVATFFLAGEQVVKEPALVGEIVAAGHRVELHCYRHRDQLIRRPSELIDDAERARAAIEDAGNQEVLDYRPPFGRFSALGLRAIRARGWRPVLWSLWGLDWRKSATPASITDCATAGARPGDILLLHDADHYSVGDSWVRTAAALPRILEVLGERGLTSRLLRR